MSLKTRNNNSNPYDIVEMRKSSNIIRNAVSYDVDPSKSSFVRFQNSSKDDQSAKKENSANSNQTKR